MTTRRLFLKGLCLSAAGATLPLLSEREAHRQIYDDPVVQEVGFGLAPVKAEGTKVAYDQPLCPCGQYHDDYVPSRYLTDDDAWYIMTHRKPTYRA